MRSVGFGFWLMIPAAALGLHWTLAAPWIARDASASLASRADASAASEAWEDAVADYAAALAALPADARAQRRELQLALGRAQVRSGEIADGQQTLTEMIRDVDESEEDDSPLARTARAELALSSYYAAWIMRLEGATADEWKPETERARQLYRYLAETAGEDAEARDESEENLEAAIRLEQMDLSELLARAKPKNCPNCKQGLCKRKRKQAASRCQGSGEEKKEEQDARREVKKDSGAGVHSGSTAGS